MKTLHIIILLLITCNVYGQKNFQPGYVVTLTGDTIHGQIDYRRWSRTPTSIVFKVNDQIETHTPTSIKAFNVKENHYQSVNVDIETSPDKIYWLSDSRSLQTVKNNVFLKTIVLGNKSLYQYIDENTKQHFYIGQNNEITLLGYKKYVPLENNEQIVSENKQFISQLLYFLGTEESVLQRTNYNKADLEKVFILYYKKNNTEVKFQEKREAIQYKLGVVSGISHTKLNKYNELSSSLNYSGGLFFDFIGPRSLYKWSLYNEILYTSYKVDGTSIIRRYYVVDQSYKSSFLKFNTLIRFNQPLSKTTSVFVNAGISNGMAFNNELKIINHQDNELLTTYHNELMSKYEMGYVFGLGVKYSAFPFDLRYERGNSLRDMDIYTNRFYFLLSYSFLKNK